MKLAIDADSNGLELKRVLIQLLTEKEIDFTDLKYLDSNLMFTIPISTMAFDANRLSMP